MNTHEEFEIHESDESDNTLAETKEMNLTTGEMSDTRLGREIAEKLQEQNYHPVVIFGSANSGKSSLLGSLLSYFQMDLKGIGIYLGDPIIPKSTPQGEWMFDQAESFFNKSVHEFLDGNAHDATQTMHPFFIPVRVVPPNLPEIKFAFMESNGEWYKPQKETNRYFPELRAEINAILKHYQNGISFIHLAPCTQINAWEENTHLSGQNSQEIHDADLALVGALNSYVQLRSHKENDSHVFLITKWDAHPKSKKSTSEHLRFVDPGDVEDIAKTLYTRGFVAFNNLNINSNQKNLMQYCSGIISGREIIKATPELQSILNRYPQTMWSWLYGNATINNADIRRRLEIIQKSPPPKKSIFDFINSFFR